jgi:hypothetical protein
MKKKIIVLTILGAMIISGLTVYGAFAAVDIIPLNDADTLRLSEATREYDYNTWMRPDVKAIIDAER